MTHLIHSTSAALRGLCHPAAALDRLDGRTRRVAGIPMAVPERHPAAAAAGLMRPRDEGRWDSFLERMDIKGVVQ
ncbi:MAG: hypothetical protein QM682_08380 [Paracoccus sp. (in: a-proteobacteria)]|uniref:hypothetical protein n=1 Tax=Paracoccus sp. TaxID=267 RepID=UPI0039E2E4C2